MIKGSYIKNIAVIVAITAFSFGGVLTMSHPGMVMQADGQMSDCPFTPGVSICEMNPLEMLAASQSLFNAIPPQKDLALLLLLSLLVAAIVAVPFFRKSLAPPLSLSQVFFRRREYVPYQNPFQELFSNGILNPKLF